MSVLVLSSWFGEEVLRGLDVVREPQPDVEALLTMPGWFIGAAEMDELPALHAIVTGSIGYDHIDVDAAAERGILVCNVPDYCVDEVADHTLALLYALVRGVVALDRDVRRGRWDSFAAGPLRTLGELTVGIVGHGRIGSAVATRLRALGCELLVHDIRDVRVPLVPLDELLGRSDAVTLHVPLTRTTRRLVGARELALLHDGALLVNTSRGAVVDVPALLGELPRLGGAALDVLHEEPPRDLPEPPNLIVTPHAAWQSAAAHRKLVAGAVEAVRTALRGERPAGSVT